MDIWSVDAPSGRALRIARQRCEAKVQARRVAYDDGLVRAQQMAVAIGGWRGYEGFAGFGLDSYRAGALDHRIGMRPVFQVDALDDIEIDAAFWSAAKTAVKEVGLPLTLYLRRQGWSDEELAELEASPEMQASRAGREMLLNMAQGSARGPASEEAETEEPTE